MSPGAGEAWSHARVHRVPELAPAATLDDPAWADADAFGTPARSGHGRRVVISPLHSDRTMWMAWRPAAPAGLYSVLRICCVTTTYPELA